MRLYYFFVFFIQQIGFYNWWQIFSKALQIMGIGRSLYPVNFISLVELLKISIRFCYIALKYYFYCQRTKSFTNKTSFMF